MSTLKTMLTAASLWKEKTLSFSPQPGPWDSVWTEPGSPLPTFLLTETWRPEYSETTVVWTGVDPPKGCKGRYIHLHSLHLTTELKPWDGSTSHAVSLIAELFFYRNIFDPLHLLPPAECISYTPPRPLILVTDSRESYEKTRHPLITQRIRVNSPLEFLSLRKTLPLSFIFFTRSSILLDTIKVLWDLPMEKTLLSLLSREIPPSGNLEDDELPLRADHQDSWIIQSEECHWLSRLDDLSPSAFSYMMLKNKFLVVNPSKSILTWRISPSPHAPLAQEGLHLQPTAISELKLYRSDTPVVVSNCFQMGSHVFDARYSYSGEVYDLPIGSRESYTMGTIVCSQGSNPFYSIAKLLLKAQGVYCCSREDIPLYRRFGLTNGIDSQSLFFTEALVYPPTEFTEEMISALRNAVNWSSTFISYDGRPGIVCEDASFEEALRPAWDVRILSPEDTFDRILANLSGAWGLVGNRLIHYSWMLPLGARVFGSASAYAEAKAARLTYIHTTKATLLDAIADTC